MPGTLIFSLFVPIFLQLDCLTCLESISLLKSSRSAKQTRGHSYKCDAVHGAAWRGSDPLNRICLPPAGPNVKFRPLCLQPGGKLLHAEPLGGVVAWQDQRDPLGMGG